MGTTNTDNLRLAELMASLSLAIDLGAGQPIEWVTRACLLSVQLADALGMHTDERRDVYELINLVLANLSLLSFMPVSVS